MRPFAIRLIVAVSASTPVHAQWEFAGPGYFTPVGVAQHDTQVFLVVGTGSAINGSQVYRSADGGRVWERAPGVLPAASNQPLGPAIYAVAAGDGVVAVATNAGIYLSTDDGDTWQARPKPTTTSGSSVRWLGVVDASTLVAYVSFSAASDSFVFASTDGGQTWTQQAERFQGLPNPSPVLVGGRLFRTFSEYDRTANQTRGGLYVSNDLGATWTLRPHVTASGNVPFVSQIAVDGARVYHYPTEVTSGSSSASTRVVWTDDAGLTYSEKTMAIGATAGSISGMAFRGTQVVAKGYAVQEGGVVVNEHRVGVSTDFGDTWARGDRDATILRSMSERAFAEPLAVAAVPAGFLYTFVQSNSNASALYASPDGLDWQPARIGGFAQDLGSVVIHQGDLIAFERQTGGGNGGGFFRSRDGQTWSYVARLMHNTTDGCAGQNDEGLAAVFGSTVVAVCTRFTGVYTSTDGRTFSRVADAPSERLKMMVEDGGRLFAIAFDSNLGTGGQRGALYRSDDQGLTWTPLATGLRTLTRLSVSGDRIVLAETGLLYLSTDAGATFSTSHTYSQGSPFVGAAATPTALFTGSVSFHPILGTSLRFFRSLDDGATWQDMIAAGLIADAPRSLHALADGSLAAVFTDSVAVTADNGATWRSLSDGWPVSARGEDAFVLRDTLYVQLHNQADHGSLWRAALSDFVASGGGTTASDGAPGDEGLELTAWPNPTAGDAQIRVRLGRPGAVTLTLSDVLGRTVAALAEDYGVSDEQTFRVDTSPLAPGVYLVRLALADGRRAVRSITVAR